MNPVVAVVLGVVVLNEQPGISAYAGFALILAGVALSQLRRGSVRAIRHDP